ncbi:MAG: hypothetical protein HFH82_00405 [Lachnospiraceae bacterium]|nr:hypothetical protein [Lachnospiraceae bacterium]
MKSMGHENEGDKSAEPSDSLMMEVKKQEGSNGMEQKVYKLMRGAGAANIAVGVIQLVVGLVTGILLIVAGAKLIAGKSKILF